MSKRTTFFLVLIGIILIAGMTFAWQSQKTPSGVSNTSLLTDSNENLNESIETPLPAETTLHPLSIEALQKGSYPGSEFVIEEKLSPGSNYQRYRVSYLSEGLKIYALLTIPNGEKPASGWPTIVFNHGYIPPDQYRTTERYVAYTDGFSRNGYILLRPDYRGHGSSEGTAEGGYGSNDYTIDILNAVASLKKHPDVDGNRLGMWGHSMGGHITLRSMVVTQDIKAGVIWAGVVASYPDLLSNWRRRAPALPPPSGTSRRWRDALVGEYGSPEQNPQFWNSISSTTFLNQISGPVQLHHGTDDDSVPVEFSEKLGTQLEAVGKPVEVFIYPGDDHNLSQNFSRAMQRSIEFFDTHVKGKS
ncbi:MAG TPA: alpha/beta fold hydrolase [Vitreimonas sp.]|nr:alpha/beta fold hydrolase [Vitreimonas sp.]